MSNTNDVRSVGHLGWHGRTPISIFKDKLKLQKFKKNCQYSERKIFEFFLVSVQDVLFISKVLFCKSILKGLVYRSACAKSETTFG